MSDVRKRILWLILMLLLAAVAWSWYSHGIVQQVIGSDIHAESAAGRVDQIKQYIISFGAAAPLVYVLLVIVEVVIAPIPGLMLYAPGGVLFGPVAGGALSLLGNVVGAAIACGLTRSMGNSWLRRFLEQGQLEQLQTKLESRGAWLIFLLRLNPLTSSDIVSYAAGFTRIPLRSVVFATGCGLAPLCFAQAWLAESLLTSYPALLYPLALLMAVYVIVVVAVLYRILVKPRRAE